MVQPLQISTITCYAVVLPLGFLILQRATMYDGIRHVLFVIPMLAVVAGLGWRALLPFLNRAPVVAAVMAGAYLGSIVATLAMLHPLEYVAMNALAGGTRRAYENFELDYWSAAASEALRRLEHRLDYDPSLRPAEAPPRILISRIAENAPRWPDMKKSTEDVGGPWGYAEFLEAIADPNHERHRELKEWFADDFNPHVLDVDWLAEDVAALAERWSRQPAVKRRRTA